MASSKQDNRAGLTAFIPYNWRGIRYPVNIPTCQVEVKHYIVFGLFNIRQRTLIRALSFESCFCVVQCILISISVWGCNRVAESSGTTSVKWLSSKCISQFRLSNYTRSDLQENRRIAAQTSLILLEKHSYPNCQLVCAFNLQCYVPDVCMEAVKPIKRIYQIYLIQSVPIYFRILCFA